MSGTFGHESWSELGSAARLAGVSMMLGTTQFTVTPVPRTSSAAIDTTLGAVQFISYHGSHIPIPGGPGDPDGIFNAIFENTEPGDSLTSPDTGSSFIQIVTWQKNAPCPVGSTILTYSESSNPTSAHFADQTKLFSKKQFLPDRFCQSQIAADPHLQVMTVRSP